MTTSVGTLFPLGLATGAAFCDRDAERERLSLNILGGQHTWIMARRRFGKSSLVAQVVAELGRKRRPRVVAEELDLLVVDKIDAVEAALRHAVGRLSGRILPKNKKVLGTVENLFRAFRPEVVMSAQGIEIRLLSTQQTPSSIQAILTALDELAQTYRRRAVLVLDEFQQLARIPESNAIEGAIRSVAQKAKALSFVFLGSERSLLAAMFEDESRPLFRLCDRMTLRRITVDDYTIFLNDAAKMRWKATLRGDLIELILDRTQRHPYYVNALCRLIWAHARRPSKEFIEAQWVTLVEQERHRTTQLVVDMSPNQRALLAQLAKTPTSQPSSQSFLATVGLPSASLLQSLGALERRDFVYEDSDGLYQLVDPVLAAYLQSL